MPRYIDAERFKLWLQENYVLYDGDRYFNDIDAQPTADVVERKRGKWEISINNSEGICSVCHYKIYGRPYNNTYLIVPYNYCPNCGADMRGEDDV